MKFKLNLFSHVLPSSEHLFLKCHLQPLENLITKMWGITAGSSPRHPRSGSDTAVYSQLSFAGVPTLSGSGGHLPNLAVAGFRQTETQSVGGLEHMGRGTPAWPTPNHPTLEWPKPRLWAGLGAYRDCDDHCTVVVVTLYASKCCFRVQF